jgi:hypothetical protein
MVWYLAALNRKLPGVKAVGNAATHITFAGSSIALHWLLSCKNLTLLCLALQERGEPPPPPLRTYYDVISCDEDATLRTIIQITTGITSIADPVQASLEHFEKR